MQLGARRLTFLLILFNLLLFKFTLSYAVYNMSIPQSFRNLIPSPHTDSGGGVKEVSGFTVGFKLFFLTKYKIHS